MTLSGKTALVLVDEGYEDLEFWYPLYRLKEEGADVTVGAHEAKEYRSKHGYPVTPDRKVADLKPEDFDAVVIPGGARCPDHLRRHKEVLDFVRAMDEAAKPVAAICHAGWVAVSAGIVKGRQMTSFSSIKDDCINAGANWVDKECVVDGNLITSRFPPDLPAFCRAIVWALSDRNQHSPGSSTSQERLSAPTGRREVPPQGTPDVTDRKAKIHGTSVPPSMAKRKKTTKKKAYYAGRKEKKARK